MTKETFAGGGPRLLSRLKALQAFEASARHGSFTAAGAELGVSPAAIGQLVRSLETWLGGPLFRRRSSGSERLIVTDDARAAVADLSAGLDQMDLGLRKLRNRHGRQVVTVTASHAIVAWCLLPRLSDFSKNHPKIDVRLDVSDRLVDVAHGEADIGVRCGPGGWPGLASTKLMGEEVYPVCSPALLEPKVPAERDWLSRQVLIHDAMPEAIGVFPTWALWLARQGWTIERPAAGLVINSTAAVVQAALVGKGVALARHGLVRDDIASGRLVRVCPEIDWPIEWGYFAVVSARALQRPSVVAFREWLITSWPSSRHKAPPIEKP